MKRKIVIAFYSWYLNALAFLAPEKAGTIAFDLFCTPQKGKLKPKDRAWLYMADEVKGLQYKQETIQCYHWKGSGSTVLLLHGWESNSGRWKKMIDYLRSKQYNIVAMDGPAHGDSSGKIYNIPLCTNMLEVVANHYQPDFLIGHSIGSATCTYFLATKPNKVKRFVLMGAPIKLSALLDDYYKLLSLGSKAQKAVVAVFEKRFSLQAATFDVAILAQTIKQPALLIHDKQDPITSYEHAWQAHLSWQNSAFVSVENQGHGLYGDDLLPVVEKFFSQTENLSINQFLAEHLN